MFNKFRKVYIFAVGIATSSLFQSVNADWVPDTNQDIVISLQSNPLTDPERACLAVTFARMLKGQGANVTLFVTLDGVPLADASVVSSPRFKCDIPEQFPEEEEVISLEENLDKFLGPNPQGNPNMVVCPLCWKSRYGSEIPDNGTKSANIGTMILNADKILDF